MASRPSPRQRPDPVKMPPSPRRGRQDQPPGRQHRSEMAWLTEKLFTTTSQLHAALTERPHQKRVSWRPTVGSRKVITVKTSRSQRCAPAVEASRLPAGILVTPSNVSTPRLQPAVMERQQCCRSWPPAALPPPPSLHSSTPLFSPSCPPPIMAE